MSFEDAFKEKFKEMGYTPKENNSNKPQNNQKNFGNKNEQKFNNNPKPYNDQKGSIGVLISKINNSGSLCNVLTVEEVSLPECAAYNVAKEIYNNLNTNQLRKIFEQIKDCEKHLPDLTKAREELYKTLPLMAYAVGRGNCPKGFFELIQACINAKRLTSVEDIERLINFVTSIVAYAKYFKETK